MKRQLGSAADMFVIIDHLGRTWRYDEALSMVKPPFEISAKAGWPPTAEVGDMVVFPIAPRLGEQSEEQEISNAFEQRLGLKNVAFRRVA